MIHKIGLLNIVEALIIKFFFHISFKKRDDKRKKKEKAKWVTMIIKM